MMSIGKLSIQTRNADIAHVFNIWSPAGYFSNYIDHLIFEWFLDGICGLIKVKDILTGAPDSTLVRLVKIYSHSVISQIFEEDTLALILRYHSILQ